MPPLPESERRVDLPTWMQEQERKTSNALIGLWRLVTGAVNGVSKRTAVEQLVVTLVPALFIVAVLGLTYRVATAPEVEASTAGLIQAGGIAPEQERQGASRLMGAEPEENEAETRESQAEGAKEAKPAAGATEKGAKESPGAAKADEKKSGEPPSATQARLPVPGWLWVTFGIGAVLIAVIYALWNWQRLEVFKMLPSSFFLLALLIIAVLGSIVFGLATPSEAAAVGGFGGFVLAGSIVTSATGVTIGPKGPVAVASSGRRRNKWTIVKESSFLPPRRAPWCAGSSWAPAFFPRRLRCSAGRRSSRNGRSRWI
jgi:TRAP-type mannitol/chloroaromatic compound transport system permease large subunit